VPPAAEPAPRGEPAQFAAEGPTTPPPAAPVPPRNRFGGVRTVVRHRATHLVAVSVLGLAVGAGVTALVAHEEGGDGGGDRGEHSREHDQGNGGEQEEQGDGR
jgi:hypothetical protein